MFRRLWWRLTQQIIEYRFHRNDRWRQTDDFMQQTEHLMMHWGYSPDDFADQLVVDLGCGSRLRSKFFRQARLVGVEPLADRFVKTIRWSDLKEAEAIYSQSAEEPLPKLEGKAAFVMSINVLDHVYDWRKVVANVFTILQPGGQFLLSVDLHERRSLTHPTSLNRETLLDELTRTGFIVERTYDELPLESRAYGEGEAFTVIATKP